MRNRRHLFVFVVTLFVCSLASMGCRQSSEPAVTDTKGNATDRDAATGTSGTGEPASPSTGTTTAAQQLGTVAPSAANSTIALTGTEEVHAQKSETTSTLQGPGGTTTAAKATPTDTTATFRTTTGTSTAAAKKH